MARYRAYDAGSSQLIREPALHEHSPADYLSRSPR